LILHIESSTKNCSVSLARDGQLIQCRELFSQDYRHSALLHCFIQEILDENKVPPTSLQAIAVSQGPGSYTGLRIGVSAAKGICYALQIPLIGINTLGIMGQPVSIGSEELIACILDARGSNLYALLLDDSKRIIKATWFENLENPTIENVSKGKQLTVVGDGQKKLKNFLPDLEATYIPEIQCPSSKNMIQFAYHKYSEKEFENIHDFEPFYLREFHPTKRKKVK